MIDGINGFSIAITKNDLRNYFLCGDINDDGYDEIIIRVSNGQLKIIYGHAGPFKNDFSTFDGIGGFVVDYVSASQTHYASYQVLCDFNGDGIKDLIFNTNEDVFVLYGLGKGKKFPIQAGNFNINYVSSGNYGHIMNYRKSINLGCGDLNNDGIDDLVILSDGIGNVIFGLKTYKYAEYKPVLNGTNGFTMDIQANENKYILQSGFGDFNGDGLQDMAVASKDSKSIYMIYGKKGGIWESHFDISSGNSSEVVKWVRDVSSPQEICLSMYVGDFNGDGISDISCNVYSLEYTWGVFGTTMKLPSVYDLNIKTSPLFGDCRGFIILNTAIDFSTWTDFNNDGVQDLIIYFNNGENYILFGEKTITSASLNIINTSINSNGESRFLESNFNPNSSGNCNVQFITFKVLDSIDASDQLSFSSSSNISSDVVSISNSELQVFNTNRDPNFLHSLSNVLYKTNRNSSFVTISITYLNIINDTIKIFISNPTINTTSAKPATVPITTSTATTGTETTGTATTGTATTGTATTGTATTGAATTGTATTGAATTGTATTGTATTGTATTGTATTGTVSTSTPPITTTATTTANKPPVTAIATTSPSTQVQQNNTVNNDCICVRGQICLPNSHICVNQFDVYQGESCFQLSCALGYRCIEKTNQIYKCVKQDYCITCADITCTSPYRCILVLNTSQKCKYQPTCSN
ncbi:tenascin X [Tieghemostelium lacteum]|uniref:Tenascin X n=1 Tax=Tieghemostelium lacteum TaxID=361077 RepID=A0A151ZDH2_TIELA|nr:tenascin X [Tieghemostelium lacteum]|eukprot:KYQ92006.1 tenascin X [Tieghemostelium lacteum]